jgi:hypothetical protein
VHPPGAPAHPLAQPHLEVGMTKNVILTGVGVAGLIGYGLALGLARAATYAEKAEEADYCRPRVRSALTHR